MKREVKIGIFGVAIICAAWAGIRFLKGFDIFARNAVYYAAYDQVSGVQNASAIVMRGVKIGSVTGIELDPGHNDRVVLQLTVKRQYRIPTDSEAKIFSDGFLGGKAIEIVGGSASEYLASGDTIRSSRSRDLVDVAGSELDFFKHQISTVTADLSRTLDNINRLLEANATHIDGTLEHLDRLSGDMAAMLAAQRQNLEESVEALSDFSRMLGRNAPRIDSLVDDLHTMSGQLAEGEFARRLTEAVDGVNRLLEAANSTEGTLGRVMNDPALYESLDDASRNLADLLADLKQYPGRYVHLSLFGRDPEKMKEKADRRAAKKAEKELRDSLRQQR